MILNRSTWTQLTALLCLLGRRSQSGKSVSIFHSTLQNRSLTATQLSLNNKWKQFYTCKVSIGTYQVLQNIALESKVSLDQTGQLEYLYCIILSNISHSVKHPYQRQQIFVGCGILRWVNWPVEFRNLLQKSVVPNYYSMPMERSKEHVKIM